MPKLTAKALFKSAMRHHKAGRLAEAETLYRRVLSADPRHADSLHHLGVIAHQVGRHDLAVSLIDRAIEMKPGEAPYYCNLGSALDALGRLDEAGLRYRQAISIKPDFAEAHFNLGSTFRDQGRLAEAAASYERALAFRPDYPEAHNNLGYLFQRRGSMREAKERYTRAVALDPKFAEAHYNLGVLHQEEGRFVEASECYHHTLALQPTDARALNNLGYAHHMLGRPLEAIDLYRRAIALAPGYADAHHNLGFLLHEQGKLEDAIASYDRAIEHDPSNAEAHNNRGNSFKELGDFEQAMASYDRCLAIAPDHAMAHLNRADLKTFVSGDPDLEVLEKLAGNADRQGESRAPYPHFALAKALEDTGDYDRAFEHLLKGNALKRRLLQYDEAKLAAEFRSIAKIFDPPMFERFAGAGAPSDLPVFIIGMPRSGTSLVEQILASHPDVLGAGELRAMDFAVEAALVGKPYPEGIADVGAEGLKCLGEDYLSRLPALPAGKVRLTDKYPRNFIYAGLIRLILPGARIIHVTRDPVDTCVSCFSRLFKVGQEFSYDLAEVGRYYRLYSNLMQHWRSVLPAGAMLEVTYEVLVENLEVETRRMIDYCGLRWDDACLRFYETKRAVSTISTVQVRQPLYHTALQRWRRYENHLGPLLKELA
jgi:tetratricopeptide (TPR) repeat protein